MVQVQNGAVTVNYREPTPRVASVPHERQMVCFEVVVLISPSSHPTYNHHLLALYFLQVIEI
jgi:hypothetical protein